MFQKLLLAFAQEKAGNTSENLLNGNRQITHFLYKVREINKKCIQR